MTPEAQRIAIAEACGYRVEQWSRSIPDYLGNLNAMHEAEKVLTDEQKRRYASALFALDDSSLELFFAVAATAAQRAEAFLRKIGKWDDTK